MFFKKIFKAVVTIASHIYHLTCQAIVKQQLKYKLGITDLKDLSVITLFPFKDTQSRVLLY